MAPCSYVNENAKEDISSLLFIKRKKTGVSSTAAKLMAQHKQMKQNMAMMGGMNPMMMGNQFGLMGGPGMNPMGMGTIGIPMPYIMSGGMGGNMSSFSAPAPSNVASINEAALLREQQKMLAQLQQAHASATSSMGGLTVPTPKVNSFGASDGASSNGAFLTNDQGNIYSAPGAIASANNTSDWSNLDAAATNSATQQALFMQQGFGGFPQAAEVDANGIGVQRLDSAANLRALINQQISLFNETQFAPSCSASSGGMVQTPGELPGSSVGGVGDGGTGLTIEDFQQFLQRNGGGMNGV